MSRTEKQKEWSAKISDFKTSGKTKEAWCKEQNISSRQLSYWIRQETEIPFPKNTGAQWIPVEIKQEESFTGSPLFVKIGSATVEVSPGFDKNFLLDVLKILKAL